MDIKTILFDLDGTLIDTNELIIASFEHTFRTFNHSFTRDEMKAFNGPPLRNSFQSIDPDNAEEMIATYREFNVKYHDDYVEIFPGVIDTIEQLTRKNINMAIVTNKARYVVKLGLSLTGLDHYFPKEKVITIDDVNHPKPHPESVIKAMDIVNGQAKTTLMVGDTSYDIDAGHQAGVKTAGVSWTDKGADYLYQYKPTYMLDEMSYLLHLI